MERILRIYHLTCRNLTVVNDNLSRAQGTIEVRSLAGPTHFRKEGKGLVNCVYKPCPAALYSAAQSCCSICHMTHYVTV